MVGTQRLVYVLLHVWISPLKRRPVCVNTEIIQECAFANAPGVLVQDYHRFIEYEISVSEIVS